MAPRVLEILCTPEIDPKGKYHAVMVEMNFTDSWRAPEREHLSLRELCYGGSFLGIRKDMERRAHGTDITLQCHGGPFTGNSES